MAKNKAGKGNGSVEECSFKYSGGGGEASSSSLRW